MFDPDYFHITMIISEKAFWAGNIMGSAMNANAEPILLEH
jgi:hypothetical protein